MEALRIALLALALAIGIRAQTTPVIGGSCKLGTPDVQIGGKQTQFFLKCETSSDAEDGSGVWVVKSRAAAAAPPADSQRSPSRLTPRPNMNPHICEQDNNARESETCTATATCLQLNQEEPSTYLQCEQTSMRWVKKRCADGLVFNFEQQTCIVPKRVHTLSPSRAVRSLASSSSTSTFSAFSTCDFCPLGTTCHDGQCLPLKHSHLCPDGSAPMGTCARGCYTPTHVCTSQGVCCPREYEGCLETERCLHGECDDGRLCDKKTLCCVEVVKKLEIRKQPMKTEKKMLVDEKNFNLVVQPRTQMGMAAFTSTEAMSSPSTVTSTTTTPWTTLMPSRETNVILPFTTTPIPSSTTTTESQPFTIKHRLTVKMPEEVKVRDEPEVAFQENSSDAEEFPFALNGLLSEMAMAVATASTTKDSFVTSKDEDQEVNSESMEDFIESLPPPTTTTSSPTSQTTTKKNAAAEMYFRGKSKLPMKIVTIPTTSSSVLLISPSSTTTTSPSTSISRSSPSGCPSPCDMTCATSSTHECGEDNCCRRFRCPNGRRSTHVCAHMYQCRAGEVCFDGLCCPSGDAPTTPFPTRKFTFVTKKYSAIFEQPHRDEDNSAMGQPLDVQPAAPKGDCVLDPQFKEAACSLRKPCPDTSQCILQRCCLLPPRASCPDGKLPLVFPETCVASDDCPVASTCINSMCCPLVSDETTTEDIAATTVTMPGDTTDETTSIEPLPTFPTPDIAPPTETPVSYESRLCSNGHESLSTPAKCKEAAECPQGYFCEKEKCCVVGAAAWQDAAVEGFITECPPVDAGCGGEATTLAIASPSTLPSLGVDSNEATTTDVDALSYGPERTTLPPETPPLSSETTPIVETDNPYGGSVDTVVTTVSQGYARDHADTRRVESRLMKEKAASKFKVRCVTSVVCNDTSLCPPGFTCTLGGRCCRLNLHCPDYAIPETLCSDVQICPSSTDSCQHIGRGLDACCSSGQQANGLICTYSSCSNSNPCQSGTCNNGYCCSSNSAPAIIDEKETVREERTPPPEDKEVDVEDLKKKLALPVEDWPVGPPGYGFPPDLATLDSVLVKATGDGSTVTPGGGVGGWASSGHCAGGFTSSLKCSLGGECPPGLFCDEAIQLCCPLLLPLTDTHNPTPMEPRRLSPQPGQRMGSYPLQTQQAAAPCPTCGTQNAPTIISIPPCGGGGCPRGYSGCCGTQQSSCCLRSQCPGGVPSTGRSCYNSCPGTQICVAGVCCPSPQDTNANFIATVSQQQSCPGGAQSYGNCNYGQCAAGYTCQQSSNQCCPNQQQNVQPSIIVSQCPGGGSSSGSCFNGGCSSGYSCNSQSNLCCPIINPFLCQDGTQAAGGCVSGQCGAGYSCVNGLCCVSSSNTPKCLDGSEAVGACIPSCVAGQCGNQQVQYFCGTGYTCTAGNICCPTNFGCQNGGTSIGPPVNGLCPTGYELSNNQCCSSATCSNGGTSAGPAVNGLCPTGYILLNGLCCSSTTAGTTCDSSVSIGPCFNGACPTLGYTCDANGVLCCPLVDYTDQNNIIGRAVEGDCPEGYTPVPINGELMCVTLQSIPGICDASEQAGPCVGNQCPSGYYCFTSAAVCCPSTLRVHRAPSADMYPGRPISYLQASVYSQMLEEQRQRQMHQIPRCPGGSHAVSACMNGLCGVGFACINELCCVASDVAISTATEKPLGVGVCPSGQPAVSSCFNFRHCGEGYVCEQRLNLCCAKSKTSSSSSNNAGSATTASPYGNNGIHVISRPIGAMCAFDEQCVGFNEGLSTCDLGYCRCTAMGFTQGIACGRRSMKFHDAVEEEEEQGSTTAVTPVASTSPAAASTSTTETTETVEAASTTSSVA